MTDFPDESRSRANRLLRMARTDDSVARQRIINYADSTPEPPLMGGRGLATRGCPSCQQTMWAQRDTDGPIWVCAGCGLVEGATLECPHCGTPMKPGLSGRVFCKTCPRWGLSGDTAEAVEQHEAERVSVMALLDAAIAERATERRTIEALESSWGSE